MPATNGRVVVVEAGISGLAIARELGRHALKPLGIDYIAVGMVGRETDCLLTTAQQYDCGHLFLDDQLQSLLRRLVVRSLNQAITYRFGGLVTVMKFNQ